MELPGRDATADARARPARSERPGGRSTGRSTGRIWPPYIWPLMTLASLFIVMGGAQGNHTAELIVGLALAVLVFAVAVYLATHPRTGSPRERPLLVPMLGLAMFYVLCAVAAGTAGLAYGIAGLLAGLIPMSALALLIAAARRKTAIENGHFVDLSAEDSEDPFPGVGLDDATPLGDTPEHAGDHVANPRHGREP